MLEIEALKLAVSKEEDAIQLYQSMLGKYPNLKDLLYDLLNEEQKHKKLLEDKIRQLTRY